MSDTLLRIVPVDPGHVPAASARIAAEALVRSLLPASEAVRCVETEHVRFIDAGENWDGVHCPRCGADAQAWWADAVTDASTSQFQTLRVRTPCCGASVSLNEMRYGWPVAFGRFSIEARNPDACDLSQDQVLQIERVLGHAVRVVVARV